MRRLEVKKIQFYRSYSKIKKNVCQKSREAKVKIMLLASFVKAEKSEMC